MHVVFYSPYKVEVAELFHKNSSEITHILCVFVCVCKGDIDCEECMHFTELLLNGLFWFKLGHSSFCKILPKELLLLGRLANAGMSDVSMQSDRISELLLNGLLGTRRIAMK